MWQLLCVFVCEVPWYFCYCLTWSSTSDHLSWVSLICSCLQAANQAVTDRALTCSPLAGKICPKEAFSAFRDPKLLRVQQPREILWEKCVVRTDPGVAEWPLSPKMLIFCNAFLTSQVLWTRWYKFTRKKDATGNLHNPRAFLIQFIFSTWITKKKLYQMLIL